jgi:hypothetical protein
MSSLKLVKNHIEIKKENRAQSPNKKKLCMVKENFKNP